MTVQANTRRRDHVGNGVALEFAAPMAYKKEHLAVYLIDDDGSVTLVSPSAYSVKRIGVSSGSIVAFNVAPTNVQKVLILRVVPYQQDVDITNLGRFLPETIERGYDLLGMQIQQLQDVQLRTLRGPEVYIGDDWHFDAEGRRITNTDTAVEPYDVPNLAQVLALIDGGGMRVAGLFMTGAFTTNSAPSAGAGIPPFSAQLTAGKKYRIKVIGMAQNTAAGSYGFKLRQYMTNGLTGNTMGRAMFRDQADNKPIMFRLTSSAGDSSMAEAGFEYAPTVANSSVPFDVEFVFRCNTSGTLEFRFGNTTGNTDHTVQLDQWTTFTVEELPYL
jgi:hypothetical protein